MEPDGSSSISLDFQAEDNRSVIEILMDEANARPGNETEAVDLHSALVAAPGRLTPGQATAVRIDLLEDGTLDKIAAS